MHDQRPVALPDLFVLLPTGFKSDGFSIAYEVIDRNALGGVNSGSLAVSVDISEDGQRERAPESDYGTEGDDEEVDDSEWDDDDE